ncbi:hypothetical protein ACOSP7_032771 [Xanthoceras sorbifolium]|uniref:Uncharacterized protein n=1 Tax=Xanthoceras sorbifolium TaxID=99658 RepID=A0ABQ8H3R6_9ROSI|nr:hypothetical protein JRO89_XS14G0042600 [Xanthoceras sorbifolium]
MVAKEFINNLEPVLLPEAINGFQGGFDDSHEEEDDEETLSLCDLAVSSNAEDYYWSEFSYNEEDQDGDFFEFSSEDFTASSYPKPNQNIIFCGKLIPYRGEEPVHHENTQNQNSTLKQQNTKKNLIFPWKSKKDRHEQAKSCDFKYDFSVKKVSSTTTTTVAPSRSKWYLLAFGSFGKGSGFPTRMELRDIKSRQSRRRVAAPTTMIRSDVGGGDMVKRGEKRSGNKGLWRLLRILGFKSHRANTVAKATFGCVPYV